MRRLLIVVGLLATMACGLVIGLDERPARPDGGATTDVDAGPLRYCQLSGGALFCDDFDEQGQEPSARWVGFQGLLPSPLVSGDASLAVEALAAASSKPQILAANVTRFEGETYPTTALLFSEVQNAVAVGEGVVFSFDTQLLSLSDERSPDAMAEKSDVGPAPEIVDEAKVAVASIAGFSPTGVRYGLVLTVGAKNVAVAEGIETGSVYDNYQRAAGIKLQSFGEQTWVRLFLGTGPRAKMYDYMLARYGTILKCPDSEFVTVGWVSVLPGEPGCIASSSVENPIATGRPFAVALGAWAQTAVSAKLRYDTVRVDLIR